MVVRKIFQEHSETTNPSLFSDGSNHKANTYSDFSSKHVYFFYLCDCLQTIQEFNVLTKQFLVAKGAHYNLSPTHLLRSRFFVSGQ